MSAATFAPPPQVVRTFVSHCSGVLPDGSLSFLPGRTLQKADSIARTITLSPANPQEHAVRVPNAPGQARRIKAVRALRFTLQLVNVWTLAADTDKAVFHQSTLTLPIPFFAAYKSGARWSGFPTNIYSGVGAEQLQANIATAFQSAGIHVCLSTNDAACLRYEFRSNNTTSSGRWVLNLSSPSFSDVSGLSAGERMRQPPGGGNTRLMGSMLPDEQRYAGFYLCLRGARSEALRVTGHSAQPLEAVAFFDFAQHEYHLPGDFLARGRYLWNAGNAEAASFVPVDVPALGAEFYLLSDRLAPFPAELLGRWLAELELVLE